MAHWNTAVSTAAISIFMTGSAAYAEVTAQQVWDDWQAYMAGFGYEMTSSESISGDTLTVSDVTMSMQLPDEEMGIRVTIGEFSFTNMGDGTVSVSVPASMPVKVTVDPEYGEDVELNFDYATTGYSVIVSGDDNALTYTYAVAGADISMEDIVVDGQSVNLGTVQISMSDIVGVSTMSTGDTRNSSQKFSTGQIIVSVDVADPEGGDGRLVFNGDYAGLSFEGAGSFPMNMDMNDVAAMLEAGFSFDGTFTSKGSSSNFNFQEEGDVVQASSKTTGGTLKVAMDRSKLHYSGSATGIEFQIAGADIPLPIEAAMGETGFNLLMPISKSDDEQDFALGITLSDFTTSDLLWSLVDPSGQLPRDPATIAADLNGKAKLFFDLMNPDEMMSVESGEMMPGELNALNLNSLTVSAAGAELTGKGSFIFDNSDLSTFDGIPAPTGSVDLKLVGGNGLLDKLVAMGLLPEDQAMGARMMMGLFAIPGDGEDTLTSKIEVSGDGSIKANGQRLK